MKRRKREDKQQLKSGSQLTQRNMKMKRTKLKGQDVHIKKTTDEGDHSDSLLHSQNVIARDVVVF